METKLRRINYSVETQIDFMNPGRSMYTPGVEKIKPNLFELNQDALKKGILLVGGLDVHFGTKEYAHRELELKINGGPFIMHCEYKSHGAEQIPETFIHGGVIHPHYLDEKVDTALLKKGFDKKALLFEKQQYNIFTNPAITFFIKEFEIKEAIVSGVLTDWCVKDAVLGMQNLGVQTYVVTDAIYALNEQEGKKAIEQMKNAGAKFVTTKDVLEGKV